MKAKIKYLCLLLIAIFVLAGCGKKQDDTVAPELKEQLVNQGEQSLRGLYDIDDIVLTQTIEDAKANGQTVLAAGLENFRDTKAEVGALLSIDHTEVSKSDKNYVIKVEYSGEHRKSELTIGFDEKMTQITLLSVVPKYTVAENLGKAALNTVLGMGTVFIILIFISFLISLFKYVNVFENKLNKGKTEKNTQPEIIVKEEKTEIEKSEDDLELVAVITAAIANLSNTDASNLIVRSIKRVKRR